MWLLFSFSANLALQSLVVKMKCFYSYAAYSRELTLSALGKCRSPAITQARI